MIAVIDYAYALEMASVTERPMMDDELLKEKYNSLLACATQLRALCDCLTYNGSRKLTKLCQSELSFLHRVRTSYTV